MYFQDYETEVFDEIKGRLEPARSLMTYPEGLFLNGIVRYFKPRKILEIGVCSGGSSAIILNAIKDIDGAKLYSVDLATHFDTEGTLMGYAVNQFFPELISLNKWELKTGKLVYKFIDEIGYDIDLCFIDTAHARPGEILDYLMVMPYLSPKCVIVIHDITYHTWQGTPQGAPCGLLFSTLRGTKYSLKVEGNGTHLPNIGAVACDEANWTDSFSVFNLLSLRWEYMIAPETIEDIKVFLSRHYSEKELYWFGASYSNQLEQAKNEAEQNAIQAKSQIQELEKQQSEQYSFSKKVKAYALFPWYLYRSIKERNH